jgi:tetratricopeptide (TPR) repeat protein
MALAGSGDRLRLVFDPVAAANDSMTEELRLAWGLEAAVPGPSATTLEELDRRFGDRPGRPEPEPAAEPAAAALERFESGRYQEALEIYRRLAARPAAEWPRFHEQPALDGFLREQDRLDHRLQAARCLIALGNHAEAGTLVEELLRAVEATEEFGGAKAAKRNLVWQVRWELIEDLIRRGLLAEAQAALEPLKPRRPDLRALDGLRRIIELPYGRATTSERQAAAAAWSRHDALLRTLERARDEKK